MNGWVNGLAQRGGYRRGESYVAGYRAGYSGGRYRVTSCVRAWPLWALWGDFRGYSAGYRDGVNDQMIASFEGIGTDCEY